MRPVTDIPGVGPALAMLLRERRITSVAEFAATPPADLTTIRGIGEQRVEALLAAARALLSEQRAASADTKLETRVEPLPNDVTSAAVGGPKGPDLTEDKVDKKGAAKGKSKKGSASKPKGNEQKKKGQKKKEQKKKEQKKKPDAKKLKNSMAKTKKKKTEKSVNSLKAKKSKVLKKPKKK
ncbi:helix-hairpin-helix domain-containing protein [Limimaricola cinnabarinus]|uniref:Helix-hairpin-helix DNA-binding motif class 1 domain-containing protein n=1 Tax=Limimaricola cinnabarinus TaxID=1125964 RepID=A0A2G1MBQ8_9RHOB|nr:helix-hairpin-helix domain-containing protein [Limimaricola cinnabarinus]PHP26169.1 hypothetical protein CJ301_17870 [Limimaricola cinnabarinus]